MNRKDILILNAVLAFSACEAEPRLVYIPATEPEVELVVRATATEVSVGEPVVLHALRRIRGEWEKVEKAELTGDQCWLHRPPPTYEEEVADNVRWEANPPKGARFNTAFRADRTREVVFSEAGTFTLESSSAIWCRPGASAKGQPIMIVVRNDRPQAPTGR